YQFLHFLRLSDYKGGCRPSAQRITDKRGLLDTKFPAKHVEEFDQHGDAIVRKWFVRFAETDLVGHKDVIFPCQRGYGHRPVARISAESVQQDHFRIRGGAGFNVNDLLAEDLDLFGLWGDSLRK